MPSHLVESVKHLMLLRAHQVRIRLEELNKEAEKSPPFKCTGKLVWGEYICYYVKTNSGEINYAFTTTYEECLQNPKNLNFMPGHLRFEPSDPNVIVGNIPVKAYLEKWLADYDALLEECEKYSEKEARLDTLEKEVAFLKKALSETLDALIKTKN